MAGRPSASDASRGPQVARRLVWIVEQHPLAALYLEEILLGAGDCDVVTLRSLPRGGEEDRNRDCLLLIDSAEFPVCSTGRLLSLQAVFPRARILLVGEAMPTHEACRYLFLGVHGFVPYASVKHELVGAVGALTKGGLWVTPQVLACFTDLAVRLSRARPEFGPFTKREWEVIGLLQRRFADKEIAVTLHISERTVRYHLAQIFDRLGVHDRHSVAELAATSPPPAAATRFTAGVT